MISLPQWETERENRLIFALKTTGSLINDGRSGADMRNGMW